MAHFVLKIMLTSLLCVLLWHTWLLISQSVIIIISLFIISEKLCHLDWLTNLPLGWSCTSHFMGKVCHLWWLNKRISHFVGGSFEIHSTSVPQNDIFSALLGRKAIRAFIWPAWALRNQWICSRHCWILARKHWCRRPIWWAYILVQCWRFHWYSCIDDVISDGWLFYTMCNKGYSLSLHRRVWPRPEYEQMHIAVSVLVSKDTTDEVSHAHRLETHVCTWHASMEMQSSSNSFWKMAVPGY